MFYDNIYLLITSLELAYELLKTKKKISPAAGFRSPKCAVYQIAHHKPWLEKTEVSLGPHKSHEESREIISSTCESKVN